MGVFSLSAATATAAAAAVSIQFQSQHPSPPPLLLLRVRGVFPATTRGGGGGGGGGAFSISTTRTQICFPKRQLLFFRVKSAVARITEISTDGQLPPMTLYFMDIGLDMDQINKMVRKYPSITRRSWERKPKQLVEFLLDIGVPPSDTLHILCKDTRLCDLSISENIIPYMAYLETLGLDKSNWPKVIKRYPNMLLHSKHKVKAIVDYLYEMGLSGERIVRVITRYPQILGCSIDGNLRPKAEYFESMGANLTSLLSIHTRVFRRSMEFQLKPVTEFFLDKGYSIDEIGTMASRFGTMYSLSLTKNLIPKWDFFLIMDYPRSELVKYPIYFGYSLEGRIKPRYAKMKECGGKLSFSSFLTTSNSEFLECLSRLKMIKMLEAQQGSMVLTSDQHL